MIGSHQNAPRGLILNGIRLDSGVASTNGGLLPGWLGSVSVAFCEPLSELWAPGRLGAHITALIKSARNSKLT